MIKTSLVISKLVEMEPIDDPNVFETVIPPSLRVQSFSPDEFEAFINEWCISCANSIYKDVYRIGGAGDMGRDVIGEYEDGSCDYYQCKRYSGKLSPSEYWLEFGKLCYYTFNQDIPMPIRYFVIASQGIGPKFSKLIKNPDKIRVGLIQNWDKLCSKKIKKGTEIKLTEELLDFINSFDFSIVDTYSIERIIEEHRGTHYFYFRFGGIRKPKRKKAMTPPVDLESMEGKYIDKILKAYSENRRMSIQLDNLQLNPELLRDFNDNRINFYCAESLKRSIRDIFTTEDHFQILKDEMYSGINDFIKSPFEDGYVRLTKTMHESTKVNLSTSIVDRDLHFVTNNDKKGLCHHLANEDAIEWVVK